jgi:imidazoleglycerol phosphate synthase cyclase subunit
VLAKRIVACLDVRDGRVVKGVRFERLRDVGDPVARARSYCEQGVDELVLLDVSATREGRHASLETVRRVAAEIDVPLTVGGGIRSESDVVRLLDAGADKVALNTAAVSDPSSLSRLSARYGCQCVVLSVDVFAERGRYELATHSATVPVHRDPLAWAMEAQERGAGEVLLTSIDRDGTRCGFDTKLISVFARSLTIPVVASGGACDADSFADALLAGAQAALGASVFHDGEVTVNHVKQRCMQRGLEIRP